MRWELTRAGNPLRLRLVVTAPYVIAFGLIGFLRHAIGPGDMWVRMASGRLVLDTLDVPRVDRFSFTALGERWLDHEWLLGVVTYALYQVDFELVIIFFVTLALAPFALMQAYAARNGSPAVLTSAVVTVAILSAWRNYTARPTVINPLFLAVLLILIDRRRADDTVRHDGVLAALQDKRIVAMLALMIIWANVHAGFLVGLATLSAWALSCFLDSRDRRAAVTTLIAAAVGVLLNPYGIGLVRYTIWAVVGNSPDRQYIQEWLSPDFHNPLNWPALPAIVLALYLGLQQMDNFRRLALIGTLTASLVSMRYEPFFAVALIFAAAPLLGGGSVPLLPRSLSLAALSLSLVALILYFGTLGIAPTRREPTAGLAYLRANCPGEMVIASIDFSSWLVYEREPVFIDGRTNQVYSNEVIRDYFKLSRLEFGWEKIPEKYGVRVVMFEKGHEVVAALEERGWTPIFQGDVEAILAHKPDGDPSAEMPCGLVTRAHTDSGNIPNPEH